MLDGATKKGGSAATLSITLYKHDGLFSQWIGATLSCCRLFLMEEQFTHSYTDLHIQAYRNAAITWDTERPDAPSVAAYHANRVGTG